MIVPPGADAMKRLLAVALVLLASPAWAQRTELTLTGGPHDAG